MKQNTYPIKTTWDKQWKNYNNAPFFKPNQKVIQELEFNYRNSDLETIVKSAWEWHKNSKY